MVRTLIVILSLVIVTQSAALAQNYPAAYPRSYPGTPDEQEACRPDAKRFCPGLQDPGMVRPCLVSHRRALKARCRAVLQRHGY